MAKIQIRVAMLPSFYPTLGDSKVDVAIVIDTLRFTTTAAQALLADAKSIQVASEPQIARDLATTITPRPLLCGERHCDLIPGFDLGNSPLEYTSERVKDRPLIFTTTNGTRAVEAVASASTTLLGSLANRAATAKYLLDGLANNVWIVCSGTDGEIAAEDVLAAGAILDRLLEFNNETENTSRHFQLANDSAMLALQSWQSVVRAPVSQAAIQSCLESASGGSNLIAKYSRDIEFCSRVDTLDCVPIRHALNETHFVKHN